MSGCDKEGVYVRKETFELELHTEKWTARESWERVHQEEETAKTKPLRSNIQYAEGTVRK